MLWCFFTSYQMLNAVYQQLSESMAKARLVGLKQGDDSRSSLLQRLRSTKHAVLFATYSFLGRRGYLWRCSALVIIEITF